MTPVIFLSDGYIANGAEPWKFPTAEDLASNTCKVQNRAEVMDEEKFQPYLRDEKLVRPMGYTRYTGIGTSYWWIGKTKYYR